MSWQFPSIREENKKIHPLSAGWSSTVQPPPTQFGCASAQFRTNLIDMNGENNIIKFTLLAVRG
jgi:hypothetical protein